MALEAFIDSKYPFAFCSMTSTPVTQPSNSDNVQHKDEQFQAVVTSLFGASSGNFLGISANIPHSNVGVVSASTNPTALNCLTNVGLRIGDSSSLAGVNSAGLKFPDMYRSSNADIDHHNLQALPLFSSHNSSISGSSTNSDLSVAQLDSHLGRNRSQARKKKCQQRCFTTKSQSGLQKSQRALLNAEEQELSTSNKTHKRPRLDIKQDAALHQQAIQRQRQSRDKMQLQSHSPMLDALDQQHELENQRQQKILQSVPELRGVDMKNQRQQQMREYLQQLADQQVYRMHPCSGNVCSRRLTQYMYHLQHRPPDNSIAYWRKFVAEYYAPCAKKRWCLSLCDHVTLQANSVFPQASMGTWQCELCSSKSGRGFEATFEVLPRLKKVQFESGVIDELLFLELPCECRLPSGLMMLEYGKAVHETVFHQFRVVRKGKLRIVFTLDLKILSWEFCSSDHEELLPRSLIASQVNEFVHAAQKYQTILEGSGSDKISPHVLEENCNMLLSAGCKLEKILDFQLVGELGFSKRYIRCLQIADVFNSMKDLMTFSWETKIGPIESLKNYSQKLSATKFQKNEFQEKEKLVSQGMAADTTKLLSSSGGQSNNENVNSNMSKDGLLTTSEMAALAHPGDYCKLLRQTSINSNVSKLGEPSSLYKRANDSRPFQGPKILNPEFTQNLPLSISQFSESNQNIQDCMIQKLLQQMVNNSRAANWAEKESVNHIINDILAGLPTNAKDTGSLGNVGTFENNTSVESISEKYNKEQWL
ncbi:hypothetical protein P3X46_016660 [Hevea brasiliensis]|uniref:LIM zinc-binding domain-containing protein n=2 Tax=Hevea brasiliensis TaxID=3981 RepID=A0ABQ9LZZ2_HEVBR|nr:probable transcriptional regulator SLK2 isoform X1 [Hevea brasiliensis]KAJ9173537.1 hypothetical protein P3X46_016660 [Hevea brasiliensis]